MIRRTVFHACLVIVLGLLNTPTVEAGGITEKDYKLEPKLLTFDSDYHLGLDFEGSWKNSRYINAAKAFRRLFRYEVELEGQVTTKSGFSTKPIQAGLRFGLVQQISRPTITDDSPDGRGNIQDGFNFGQLSLTLDALGSHQTEGDSDLVLAARLGYLHNKRTPLWWLIPSWAASYGRVTSESSDLKEVLGAPDQFNRWQVEAGWFAHAFLAESLSAHVDLRWTGDSDQPEAVKALELDEAFYLAGGLMYTPKKPMLKYLQGIHFMVSDGRIPPSQIDETTYHLGFWVFK